MKQILLDFNLNFISIEKNLKFQCASCETRISTESRWQVSQPVELSKTSALESVEMKTSRDSRTFWKIPRERQTFNVSFRHKNSMKEVKSFDEE